MVEDPKIYIGLRLKGRYLVEEHIGSGLSAHAFKAYDTLLQGRVVVKIINAGHNRTRIQLLVYIHPNFSGFGVFQVPAIGSGFQPFSRDQVDAGVDRERDGLS